MSFTAPIPAQGKDVLEITLLFHVPSSRAQKEKTGSTASGASQHHSGLGLLCCDPQPGVIFHLCALICKSDKEILQPFMC